jgi:hypothetical protein
MSPRLENHRRGWNSGLMKSCKLTESDVAQMKRRHSAGESVKTIARDFPVREKQVAHILHGGSWYWVRPAA